MPVRTLADLRNNNNGPSNQPMPSYNNQQARQDRMQGSQNRVIVIGGGDADGAVAPPLNKFLAPDFNKFTFIFFITVVQIIMFFTELVYAWVYYGTPFDQTNVMAGPGSAPLVDLGAKKTLLIRQGQIYRLATPALLHGGILHIFMNLFFQTILCYTYEKKWGTGRIAFFYLITAIGASSLSAVTTPIAPSVGASGSLFGMLGCQIAYLLMNWNVNPYMSPEQQAQQPISPKTMELLNIICIILLNFSMAGTSAFSGTASGGEHIDNFAHIGGLISGILIGFAFVAVADGPVSCMSNVQYTKIVWLF